MMELVARVLHVTIMAAVMIVRVLAALAVWIVAFVLVWIGAVMLDRHPDPSQPAVQMVGWITFVCFLALVYFGSRVLPRE